MDFNESSSIIWDDSDFGYASNLPPSYVVPMNKSFMSLLSNNILPFVIVLTIVLSEIFLVISILFIFIFRKYNQSPSYHILTHYFIFQFFFCFMEFFNILTSVAFESTSFHLRPTTFLCIVGRFSTFFFEASKNFQIVLIWIVLLSERKLIGFRYLISDYELRRHGPPCRANNDANLSNEASLGNELNQNRNSSSGEVQMNGGPVDSYLTKLKQKNFRNFLILNSRTLVLFAFYMLVAAITFMPISSMYVTQIRTTYRCSIYRHFDVYIVLIVIVFGFLFFLPSFYWVIALSTVFSKLFGGVRDPLLTTLSEHDLKHLKFLKIASVLKYVENFFLHIISTHDIELAKYYYEITRIVGLLLIFTTTLLFIIFENVLVRLRHSLFSDDSTNRVSYFVFRNNREADEEAIVYRNLVENA